MQLWPAKENALAASFEAARSRSASAATITGVELPSSRRTRFFAARSAMPQPTPLEPVNVIIRTRSSSTRTSPISADGPTRTVSQPGGRPASCSSSASRSAESGVWLAGLSTTGQPAARGGGGGVGAAGGGGGGRGGGGGGGGGVLGAEGVGGG